jgi:hypothetical protein
MNNKKLSFIEENNIFMDNTYPLSLENMTNKLFCTFTPKDNLEETVATINRRYTILFSKIFVLESQQSDELICTYNIDTGNTNNSVMANTILVHRKKDTNTLYSINALNTLIKQLNNGILDNKFIIQWDNYRNCILLTTGNDLRRLDTAIYRIVDFSIR